MSRCVQMMFSKRSHGDFKKSAQKVLDCRKDVATRLKHLRFILAETSDLEELKLYFDANFSQIYFIFFENFTSIEMAIKQKGFRSHKEDLEYIVTIFEFYQGIYGNPCLNSNLYEATVECHYPLK